MQNKIIVVDSIMGSGKTSTFIDYINNNPNKKIIYITPYLSEIARVKENCKSRRFYDPINIGKGKLDSFNKLLLQGRDIVSTHALFKLSTEETRDLIASNDYVLILDEVMDVLQEVNLEKDDLDVMLKLNLISVDDSGLVSWNEALTNYDTRYNDIKLMCRNNSLFLVNNCLFMWTFPINIFQSFSEVYVLTYLFSGQIQKYYYDLYNVDYEYLSVRQVDGKYELCDYIEKYDMEDIRSKINLIMDKKLNAVGEEKYALSKSWFRKKEMLVDQLQKNVYNYFTNKVKSKSKENMWTTFKDYRSKITGKRYSKGFISLGARATNDYADKQNIAYCANIFLNPMIEHFFYQHGVKVDEDIYALSELVQWIWRGRIRKGENINLYIPSKRMRTLFLEWLK